MHELIDWIRKGKEEIYRKAHKQRAKPSELIMYQMQAVLCAHDHLQKTMEKNIQPSIWVERLGEDYFRNPIVIAQQMFDDEVTKLERLAQLYDNGLNET